MANNTTIRGKVTRYYPETMGSFRNVALEGCDHKITIGIGDGLTYPAIGQWIEVYGETRNGRFLTSTWNYILPETVQQFVENYEALVEDRDWVREENERLRAELDANDRRLAEITDALVYQRNAQRIANAVSDSIANDEMDEKDADAIAERVMHALQ